MLRLSFAWRVTLVLILALIAVQIGSSALFFVQRSAATSAGIRIPFPDQVAALVTLIDRSGHADRQLVLRALNGPGLTATIRSGPIPAVAENRRLSWLERSIRRNLGAEDGRIILAQSSPPPPRESETRLGRRSLFLREPVEIIVGLADGGSLAIRSTDALSVRLFGLPSGFFASLLGLAVAVIAGFAILRETRPLVRLAKAVERFGQGMRPEAMPEKGAPEVRSLVRAFNAMQARISRLVHARTFVVAAIAHDLRTHLTRLRLRVAMISDETVRERAERDVEDMQALIEAALVYAKSTRGNDDRGPVDLAKLIEEIAHSRRETGAEVRIAIPDLPVTIQASRIALSRAIGNLVDNAVLYGGVAELSLRVEGREAVLLVEDRGPGVPPDERDRILEPFERLESSRGRDTGGAGLGLAIVREIVDAHGGGIVIEDRSGGGARFAVHLPL